ncbi:serine hydroxymethyltransferase 1, mitochondrial-like [Curcuma longa]|uniref:serine hydroxymethyltransferase 1, mitochondrial-like n=1 Tax=Curcuma longa TaxID=136217 RepID=UPI003D9EDE22
MQTQKALVAKGFELVSGGTENHLVLANLKNKGIDGSRVEKVLELVHITANKSTVLGDVSAMVPGGIIMGTPTLTSRGFVEEAKVDDFFNTVVNLALKIKSAKDVNIQSEIKKLCHPVEEYAKQFPTLGFEKETMKYKDKGKKKS